MALIPRHCLPESLWRDGVLYLPNELNDVYETKLTSLGLMEAARSYAGGGGSFGGESMDLTYDHFCKMYPNSASRVQCLLLDPHGSFANIPRDLLISLSSHRVAILDIPCGAGASMLSLLATLGELRATRLIPLTPLSIRILGADISTHALDIYRDQFGDMNSKFAQVGINVTLETQKWDARDVIQTNQLIDDWFVGSAGFQEYLVLVSNFSGESKRMFSQFEESIRLIWIRLSSRATMNSTIVWIEPQIRSAWHLFKKLQSAVARTLHRLILAGEGSAYHSCTYSWYLRLQDKVLNSGVCVQQYSRDRRS